MIIGITLDSIISQEEGVQYKLRENYLTAISNLGAEICLLHYQMNPSDRLLKSLNGIIISGGNFDIDPQLYKEEHISDKIQLNIPRTQFEIEMYKYALANSIPLLGICGGHQLINVVRGGTLIQDIPQQIETQITHKQQPPYNEFAHNINIIKNSLLHSITGLERVQVNSSHHQAIKDLGDDLAISAVAEDGIIEAIEYTKPDWFCMGVQWHPEHTLYDWEKEIFRYFLHRCKK